MTDLDRLFMLMTRRQELDHDRYMRQREERLAKQKAYYRENRERCIQKVRECQKRREEYLYMTLMRKKL